MREVWVTPAGNLRIRRVIRPEYISRIALEQFFATLAETRYQITKRGFEYLGEL